jgi:hypothetical protein
MRLRNLAAGLCIAAATVAVAASPATADPIRPKNAFFVQAFCDNGQTLGVVVNSANGQGQGAQDKDTAVFTPAHVIGTNEIFHPTTLDLIFTFAPNDGPLERTSEFATRPNQTGDVTCDISSIGTTPEGTFELSGTVVGWLS